MSKIKLKTLGLPKTTGTLKQKVSSASSTDYENIGTTISEIYWQESDGRVAGEMLGIETTVWIPYNACDDIPARGNLLYVDNIRYEILDIKRQIYSQFEDHYELFISDKNS